MKMVSLTTALLTFSLLATVVKATHLMRVQCNHKEDGLTYQQRNKYGVSKAQLRCNAGLVDWTNPYGGLRIEFLPPVESVDDVFTVCFLSAYSGVTIYKENGTGLYIMKRFDWHNPRQPVCIDSQDGKAVAMLDVAEKGLARVRLDYELEMNSIQPYRSRKKKLGCSHCRRYQVMSQYCDSDFAIEAVINDRFVHVEETHIQLDLLITRIIRQRSANLFHRDHKNMYHTGSVAALNKCALLPNHKYMLLGRLQKRFGATVSCFVKFHLWKRWRKDLRPCKQRTQTNERR